MKQTQIFKWIKTPLAGMQELKQHDVFSIENPLEPPKHLDLFVCEADPEADVGGDGFQIRVSHLIKDPDFK